jgi:phage gp45-like
LKFLKTIIRRVIISAVREGAIKRFDAAGVAGEQFLDREFLQQYGLTSRPLADSEGLILGVGNVFYLIATDDRRYRVSLQDGEVALYTDEGDKIHLKRGKVIEITSGAKVTINAPAVELAGGTLKKLIDERLVDAFNSHTHPTAALGSPSPPTTPLVLANVATEKTKAS